MGLEASTIERSGAPQMRSPRTGRLLRLVRRLHMYLGLLLLPWLGMYGLSGVLFNHPGLCEAVRARRLAPEDFNQALAWRAPQAAASVVAAINRNERAAELGELRLDPRFPARFVGYTMLDAPAPDGRYTLFVQVERGVGVLVKRTRPRPQPEPLAPLQLQLPELSMAAVERAAQGLLQRQGLPVVRELRANPQVAPKLRLRVLDQAERAWNLEYDSFSGTVSGRRAGTAPNLGFAQLMATLHTTHHFPLQPGPRLFWALFQDLLGVAMLLWSLTGAVMWWQLKKTRLLGGLALTAALSLAAWVSYTTSQDVLFGDVRPQLGPGE